MLTGHRLPANKSGQKELTLLAADLVRAVIASCVMVTRAAQGQR